MFDEVSRRLAFGLPLRRQVRESSSSITTCAPASTTARRTPTRRCVASTKEMEPILTDLLDLSRADITSKSVRSRSGRRRSSRSPRSRSASDRCATRRDPAAAPVGNRQRDHGAVRPAPVEAAGRAEARAGAGHRRRHPRAAPRRRVLPRGTSPACSACRSRRRSSHRGRRRSGRSGLLSDRRRCCQQSGPGLSRSSSAALTTERSGGRRPGGGGVAPHVGAASSTGSAPFASATARRTATTMSSAMDGSERELGLAAGPRGERRRAPRPRRKGSIVSTATLTRRAGALIWRRRRGATARPARRDRGPARRPAAGRRAAQDRARVGDRHALGEQPPQRRGQRRQLDPAWHHLAHQRRARATRQLVEQGWVSSRAEQGRRRVGGQCRPACATVAAPASPRHPVPSAAADPRIRTGSRRPTGPPPRIPPPRRGGTPSAASRQTRRLSTRGATPSSSAGATSTATAASAPPPPPRCRPPRALGRHARDDQAGGGRDEQRRDLRDEAVADGEEV